MSSEKEKILTNDDLLVDTKEKRDEILFEVDNDKIVELQGQASIMFEKLREGEKIEMLKD